MSEPIDRRHWLLLLVAVVMFACVLFARRRMAPGAAAREQVSSLRAEIERLRDCDELRVRTETEALAHLRSTSAASPHPSGWRPLDHDRSRWSTDAIANWSELLAALHAIEQVPLRQLQIRTTGSLTRREISSVEAVLLRPAATPPRREAGGAASAAHIETKRTEAAGASLATRAGPRSPRSESPNQP
ncbi:MAG: hypothetical protein KF715_19780 [Candidatus Didemnitutus sp.]|nr:hypothetical protein [Candidatus Didemnitutus sp.]